MRAITPMFDGHRPVRSLTLHQMVGSKFYYYGGLLQIKSVACPRDGIARSNKASSAVNYGCSWRNVPVVALPSGTGASMKWPCTKSTPLLRSQSKSS